MMGIGFPELMIILVIIMIIFGAGKLPEIGSAFGRSIKNFKTSMKEAEAGELETESETVATESAESQQNLQNLQNLQKEQAKAKALRPRKHQRKLPKRRRPPKRKRT